MSEIEDKLNGIDIEHNRHLRLRQNRAFTQFLFFQTRLDFLKTLGKDRIKCVDNVKETGNRLGSSQKI